MSKKVRPRLTAAEKLVLVKERLAKSLAKAEESLRKAEERLTKAKERLARIQAETPHKLRLAELAVEVGEHRDALKKLRPAPKEAPPQAAKKGAPAGSVTTECGELRELTKEAVGVIKTVIGRKRKGILAPLDGAEAQSLLTALDEKGNVGDSFTVTLKGRKSALQFTVVAEGLEFRSA
jgi:hypothetical protein